MSWSIGWDSKWQRDIGYGVPALCDHPGCNELIDRGLAHVCCGEEIHGGEGGCGLYFCERHHQYYRKPTPSGDKRSGMCSRCYHYREPFPIKRDAAEWTYHKMTDSTWSEWRKENGL